MNDITRTVWTEAGARAIIKRAVKDALVNRGRAMQAQQLLQDPAAFPFILDLARHDFVCPVLGVAQQFQWKANWLREHASSRDDIEDAFLLEQSVTIALTVIKNENETL